MAVTGNEYVRLSQLKMLSDSGGAARSIKLKTYQLFPLQFNPAHVPEMLLSPQMGMELTLTTCVS